MSSGISAPRTVVSSTCLRIFIALAFAAAALAVGGGVAFLISLAPPAVTTTGWERKASQDHARPALPAMAFDSGAPSGPAAAQTAPDALSTQEPVFIWQEPPVAASTLLARPQQNLTVLPPQNELPLPPSRPPEFAWPGVSPAGPFDQWTAIYVLARHTVYMPDGTLLEAHSGLGDRLDDPRHVDERDRGATPPHLYDLTLREQSFHGVQALRLTPVGSGGGVFGRDGLLAHSYMLGPNGDSNGCVSFKNYDAFLQAFQSGKIRRLAVVADLMGKARSLEK
jgi:hypothetical protein